MSLQLAAQHLSSHGRGNDSTLVHMSPREVKSLNDLAHAAGGQLTTNPHTGLPEAGFLESLLPAVAGFALNAAMPGSGMMVPALIGGGTALLTGSLSKGLMAGLGAYGGANLGETLAQQGIEQATAAELAKDTTFSNQLAAVKQAAQNQFVPPTGADQATINAAKDAYRSNISELGNQAANTYNTTLANQGTTYKDLGFMDKLGQNFNTLTSPGGAGGLFDKISGSPMSLLKTVGSAIAPAGSDLLTPKKKEATAGDSDLGPRYGFSMNPANRQQVTQAQPGQSPLSNTSTPTATPFPEFPTPDPYGRENRYFSPAYTQITPTRAKSIYGFADGGVASEDSPATTPALQMFQQMQAQRAAQTPAPKVDINAQYADYLKQTMGSPAQTISAPKNPAPTSTDLASSGYAYDPVSQKYSQIQGAISDTIPVEDQPMNVDQMGYNWRHMASGGISSHLGDYSDGGRLLRGPGDGVSDSIPATIGKKQPARLADGEFVVPARIVSELGNGSTEAGARKLYAMMDRIQSARGTTVGKGKVAKNSRSEKYLPA